MAVKTKLNTSDDDEVKEGLKDADDLDAAYIHDLKTAGMSEDLLAQFVSISEELSKNKK